MATDFGEDRERNTPRDQAAQHSLCEKEEDGWYPHRPVCRREDNGSDHRPEEKRRREMHELQKQTEQGREAEQDHPLEADGAAERSNEQ